jgi:hypothetical protein
MRIDHVVDGIAAGATDPQYGDPRLEFFCLLSLRHLEIDRHGEPPYGEAMLRSCGMMHWLKQGMISRVIRKIFR